MFQWPYFSAFWGWSGMNVFNNQLCCTQRYFFHEQKLLRHCWSLSLLHPVKAVFVKTLI